MHMLVIKGMSRRCAVSGSPGDEIKLQYDINSFHGWTASCTSPSCYQRYRSSESHTLIHPATARRCLDLSSIGDIHLTMHREFQILRRHWQAPMIAKPFDCRILLLLTSGEQAVLVTVPVFLHFCIKDWPWRFDEVHRACWETAQSARR